MVRTYTYFENYTYSICTNTSHFTHNKAMKQLFYICILLFFYKNQSRYPYFLENDSIQNLSKYVLHYIIEVMLLEEQIYIWTGSIKMPVYNCALVQRIGIVIGVCVPAFLHLVHIETTLLLLSTPLVCQLAFFYRLISQWCAMPFSVALLEDVLEMGASHHSRLETPSPHQQLLQKHSL